MNAIQKRIDELYSYVPDRQLAPADLADFWERTLSGETARVPYTRTVVRTPMQDVEAYKVIYEGDAHTPIHAWHLVPSKALAEPAPCLVVFHGYGGSKGEPEDYAAWVLMGFAVFAVDVRGQSGETGNALANTYGMAKGWITQGIMDPHTCYYKALAIDGIRAVRCAREQPGVDPARIIAMGASQGGGLALLTAALEPGVHMAVADIPNMCRFDFGLLNSTGSLTEATQFVSHNPERLAPVLVTLSYFDIVHLADRITVPVWMSVGLKDTVCMPETVFAAYNALASAHKHLHINPFLGHELPRGHTRLVYDFIQRSRC